MYDVCTYKGTNMTGHIIKQDLVFVFVCFLLLFFLGGGGEEGGQNAPLPPPKKKTKNKNKIKPPIPKTPGQLSPNA